MAIREGRGDIEVGCAFVTPPITNQWLEIKALFFHWQRKYDARIPGLTMIVQTTTVAMFIRRESGVRTCSLCVVGCQ